MKKIAFVFLASVLLLSSFAIASDGYNGAISSSGKVFVKSSKSQSSSNQGGGRIRCLTDWTWNGEQWVKRPLLIISYGPKGQMHQYVREAFNGCKTIHERPKGVGNEIDLVPMSCMKGDYTNCKLPVTSTTTTWGA